MAVTVRLLAGDDVLAVVDAVIEKVLRLVYVQQR
jgi:hypothetical protein